jgi:DNA-binding MarR family transcriptional regulator
MTPTAACDPGDGFPLCALLGRLEALFVAEFEDRLADAGFPDLSLAHSANVLRYLDSGCQRPAQIAGEASVTKQAISQQIAYLQRHGYVAVGPDPHDSRAREVVLTAKGRRAQRVAQGLFAEIESDWGSRAGKARVAALRTSLEETLERLGAPICS